MQTGPDHLLGNKNNKRKKEKRRSRPNPGFDLQTTVAVLPSPSPGDVLDSCTESSSDTVYSSCTCMLQLAKLGQSESKAAKHSV